MNVINLLFSWYVSCNSKTKLYALAIIWYGVSYLVSTRRFLLHIILLTHISPAKGFHLCVKLDLGSTQPHFPFMTNRQRHANIPKCLLSVLAPPLTNIEGFL